MYSAQVLDHFQHPRNAGEVANPDSSVQIENPACGDVLKLTFKIVDGRIEEIRFLAQGCVPTMACASILTELLQGKTITEARQLRREELVKAVWWFAQGFAACQPSGNGRFERRPQKAVNKKL